MRYLLLLLLAITASAQTTVYLRYGTPGGYSKITNATNETPIVVTTAEAHGFNTGDFVWIQGLYGNWHANGLRKVANATSTTFALNDINDNPVAGNGAYAHNGIVGKVQPYTLRGHPRLMLDGPGGDWTTKFASPSIKAVAGWAPWDALVTANNARQAGGSGYNTGDNARNLALGWFMDSSRTSWRDAAIQMIADVEKKVASGTSAGTGIRGHSRRRRSGAALMWTGHRLSLLATRWRTPCCAIN